MEFLSITLFVIAVAVLIFSYWSFAIIKKHVNRFNNNFKHSSSLSDEKYFELKTKQEYIIAASALIFSVISFMGVSSIKEIKKDLNNSLATETKKLENLGRTAEVTNESFSGLSIKGKTIEDSLRSAMNLVEKLKRRVSEISSKDVINLNIFIVDPLVVGDFPIAKEKYYADFRQIKFNTLKTISGDKLPDFKVPPSIICFPSNNATIRVTDITKDGFKISADMFDYITSENAPNPIKPENVRFSVWISQKSTGEN